MQKSIQTVLLAIVLSMPTLSMFAQGSEMPAAQSVSGADAQSNSISDKDIEMLRADLRAQRKQITA